MKINQLKRKKMDDIDMVLADLAKRRNVLYSVPLWTEKEYQELADIREINKRLFFFLKGKRAVYKNSDYTFTEAMNDYEKTQI